MKVVAPFRPFAPESPSHLAMPDFDWPGALEMLRASVRRSCGCETFALTDVDTTLPVPSHAYETHQRRLMLWLIEVCGCYLASDAFDQDTVMLSPDMLVYQDLAPFFRADLGIVARLSPKFLRAGRTLLFGAQFWSLAAKPRLAALYRRALAMARSLDDVTIQWGADIAPFYELLRPAKYGTTSRGDLSVHLFGESEVMASITGSDEQALSVGTRPTPPAPIVDFRYRRKLSMRAYFDLTIGAEVTA